MRRRTRSPRDPLQAITRKLNVLAVVVIHQPRVEVVGLFDTLLLLTSSPGRLTYQGPMAQARGYFESLGFGASRARPGGLRARHGGSSHTPAAGREARARAALHRRRP